MNAMLETGIGDEDILLIDEGAESDGIPEMDEEDD